jgi:hypothetical protein
MEPHTPIGLSSDQQELSADRGDCQSGKQGIGMEYHVVESLIDVRTRPVWVQIWKDFFSGELVLIRPRKKTLHNNDTKRIFEFL